VLNDGKCWYTTTEAKGRLLMKQLLTLSVAVGVLVSMAMAVEQNSNAVGFHEHTVDSGQLILVSPTLDNLIGNQLEDILGDQLPVNSAVFKWNGLGYDPPAIRTAFFGWQPNIPIDRGQAIFVQNANSASGATTFSFDGEVPDYSNGGGTTSVSVTGLDGTAYPYPVDIEFGDTQTAIAAPINASVFFWNIGSQSYDAPTTKWVFFGWGPTETRNIPVGEAYFMESPSPILVDEVQPYELDL